MNIFQAIRKSKEINQLNAECEQVAHSLKINTKNLEEVKREYNDVCSDIKLAQSKLEEIQNLINGYTELEEIGYEFSPLEDSGVLQAQLAEAERNLAVMVGCGEDVAILMNYTINGSVAKGNKFQTASAKNLAASFNAYCKAKEKTVTRENKEKTIELVRNQAARLNKNAGTVGVCITQEYIDARIDIIERKLRIKINKAFEKEQERERKRKLREEEKLLEEIAKAEEELAKEQRYYMNLLGRKITEEERQEYKNKLNEIDKRIDDYKYRRDNLKAGWLYVVSTKSMEGMVKIGATRRLDPMVRIRELSSSSLPFPFKCHGVAFCEDVFDIETKIHAKFDDKRVSPNKHKEFFYITPEEAIEVLTKELGCTVNYIHPEDNQDD